mgnify:FL=1
MLEWFPLVLVAGALFPKITRMNELQKIEQVFRNLKFAVRTEKGEIEFPDLIKRQNTEAFRRYDFRLPLGLTLDDKLIEKMSDVLSKTLHQTVEIEGGSIMSIWIFKQKMPNKWAYKDIPATQEEGLLVPLGRTHKDMMWHDFDKIPHMTIAGATRWGKTVFMKVMFTYLIETYPDDVEFYIIDLKGGLEFHKFRNLKQVKSIASDAVSAYMVLNHIHQDILADMEHFKEKGYTNIVDTPLKRRRFIIVDEGAELAPDKSDPKEIKQLKGQCQQFLSNIARISGALGYRLLFATQYPTADTLPRQIKQNADAKVSFRLGTGYASEVAIDEHGAEQLDNVGRAIYKTYEKHIVQVPYISNDEMWERLRGYETYDPNEKSEEMETMEQDIIKFG